MNAAWVLTTLVSIATPQQVVETARTFLGVRYSYGASDAQGVDCSGFVQQVLAAHGVALPRTAREQAGSGESISWDEVRAGDLLFFTESPGGGRTNHVGIALGDGTMIHASTGRGEVVIDTLSLRYYADRRGEARRVLGARADTALSETEALRSSSPSLEAAPPIGVSAQEPHALTRLTPARTALGLRAGVAPLEAGGSALVGALLLSLRLDAIDLHVALQAPFATDLRGAALWRFTRAEDYLRGLESFRLGQPDSRLYLEASRDLALTLGQGALIASSTPSSAHRDHAGFPSHPGFPITSRAVGAGFDVQLVLDDVVEPRVLGARWGGAGAAAIAVEVAADPQRSRGAAGLEARMRLAERSRLIWSTDLTLAAANTHRANGAVVAGTWLTHRTGSLELGARAAAHARQPGFVPGLFNATYRATPTRWDELDAASMGHRERWGWELTTDAAYARHFAARARYRHDAPLGAAGPHASARELEVRLTLRDLYVASLSSYASASASYVRPLDDPERALLFAGARLHINDVVNVAAQIARRPPTSQHSELMSAFVDLTAEIGL